MEFRIVTKSHKLHFSLERIERVKGVNSKINKDTHFLMWDFDDIPLALVQLSLEQVQRTFSLPTISILSTGKENGYHAYCFKACSFLLARTILAHTANIDTKYFGIGCMRGYFTLRYSDIKGRNFEPICSLLSSVPADITYREVNHFVEYTKRCVNDW